jgi:putative hydrolase of the HAD superfamily
MSNRHQAIFRAHCRPLAPRPTGAAPALRKLRGVRAVLFDIYGTLLVSASGDVGAARQCAPGEAFAAALAAVGLPWSGSGQAGVACLLETIEEDHAAKRARGVEYPEVEITDVWRKTLAKLRASGELPDAAAVDVSALAVEYEARVNPAWPMPDMLACLRELRAADRLLGLVSNAQFYTLELLPALLGETMEQLGVDPELQFYSYRVGEGKPGETLYRQAAAALAERGVSPPEVLYVGNDMLNDVWPARRVGFQTALFAGDARSLRLREGDPRVQGVTPDLIVTRLADLPRCVPDED